MYFLVYMEVWSQGVPIWTWYIWFGSIQVEDLLNLHYFFLTTIKGDCWPVEIGSIPLISGARFVHAQHTKGSSAILPSMSSQPINPPCKHIPELRLISGSNQQSHAEPTISFIYCQPAQIIKLQPSLSCNLQPRTGTICRILFFPTSHSLFVFVLEAAHWFSYNFQPYIN